MDFLSFWTLCWYAALAGVGFLGGSAYVFFSATIFNVAEKPVASWPIASGPSAATEAIFHFLGAPAAGPSPSSQCWRTASPSLLPGLAHCPVRERTGPFNSRLGRWVLLEVAASLSSSP